jgi:hypothetical protein
MHMYLYHDICRQPFSTHIAYAIARMAISNATKVAPFANGDLASVAFHSRVCTCADEEEDENKDRKPEAEDSPDKSRS